MHPRGLIRRVSFIDVFLWAFRLAVIAVVIVGSAATLAGGRYTGRQWLDFVEFGLAQGAAQRGQSRHVPRTPGPGA